MGRSTACSTLHAGKDDPLRKQDNVELMYLDPEVMLSEVEMNHRFILLPIEFQDVLGFVIFFSFNSSYREEINLSGEMDSDFGQ
ncbi:hypothetical protein CEXT_722941 [Caerostris extrusa]|uniref:Uncharacterized protein n=1 Tax=Caerostris extrusa TaxID=172846 RepID=A0AAV4XX28_CAEEX|nr:hypothetical protein CEXT_722941 [Caerostris extrusa]